MKKLLALLLVLLLIMGTVTGCNPNKDETASNTSSDVVSSEDEYIEDDYEDEYDDYEDDYEYEDVYEDYYEDDFEVEVLTPVQQRAKDIFEGNDKEIAKAALASEGDLSRFAKAIRKAQKGQAVTVAFYGGNNTANNDETVVSFPFVASFQEWWEEYFGTECNLVQQGFATMTSAQACARVDHDILKYEPDIVFLDFSVQDNIGGGAKSNAVGYDNLVRRILNSKNNPAVVTMLLAAATVESYDDVNVESLQTAAKYHKQISQYHNIPVIDMEEALWDTIYSLVEVSEKTESLAIKWTDIASDNVTYSNEGHAIVYSMVKYFVQHVESKLSKISTKIPAGKAIGYFANDKYMKGSMYDIAEIIDSKAKGYSLNLEYKKGTVSIEEYNYENFTSEVQTNTMYPNITTYRHFIPSEEQDQTLAKNPRYLEITIPEVAKNKTTYLMYSYSTEFSATDVPSYVDFEKPLTLEFYDKDGKSLGTLHDSGGYYADAPGCSKYVHGKIPTGTTKVIFKCYTSAGEIRIHGVGSFAE